MKGEHDSAMRSDIFGPIPEPRSAAARNPHKPRAKGYRLGLEPRCGLSQRSKNSDIGDCLLHFPLHCDQAAQRIC
jgi:hypothetical protein